MASKKLFPFSSSSIGSNGGFLSQTKVGLDACSQLLLLFFFSSLAAHLLGRRLLQQHQHRLRQERAVHARVCTVDDDMDDDDVVDDGGCMAYAPKQYTDNKNKFMKKVFEKVFLKKKIVKSMEM